MRRIGAALGLLLGNRILPSVRTIAVARGRGGGGGVSRLLLVALIAAAVCVASAAVGAAVV